MSAEQLWNYCYAAQKYLLGDGGASWNFKFAERERIFAANKVLLIPPCMDVMQMQGSTYHNGERDVDVFIGCSEFPQLHVRLGKSTEEVILVLNKDELVQEHVAGTSAG